MNRFATIITEIQFNKVTYYGIQFDDEEDSLFYQFITKHIQTNQEELFIIQNWLKKIGNEIGAIDVYFRHEGFRGSASALPPPKRYLSEVDFNYNLRLYCMRINKRVVVLFNGGIKTAQKAQDCDNVRPAFLLANKITKVIDEAIIDKEIQYDEFEDLIIPNDFILEIKI